MQTIFSACFRAASLLDLNALNPLAPLPGWAGTRAMRRGNSHEWGNRKTTANRCGAEKECRQLCLAGLFAFLNESGWFWGGGGEWCGGGGGEGSKGGRLVIHELSPRQTSPCGMKSSRYVDGAVSKAGRSTRYYSKHARLML